MLYVTTRNKDEVFTAHRVLTGNRGPDGGLFVPYRLPVFSEQEILSLADRNFNANVAQIINLFFSSRLVSQDLDLALGRRCVRLQQLGQRIIMGECWHNTDWTFDRLVADLTALLVKDSEAPAKPKGWAGTGIRIAVLFGMFGELIREGIAAFDRKVDVSLVSGDFEGPMAAWYARAMGLPIGNIICCCNENAALWDFICHGQLRTDGAAVPTMVPEADVQVPQGLERLIGLYGGQEEVDRYVGAVHEGSTYYLEDAMLHRLRQGIYVTVSSEKRILQTIPAAFATHRYVLCPAAALAYSGLQDYRARTGEMPNALILTEQSPGLHAARIASAIGIPESALPQYL